MINIDILPEPICVSIGEQSCEAILAALNEIKFAEIRLDVSRITLPEIRSVFSCGKLLVATCREGFYSKSERIERLVEAIHAGAAFVDVETESDDDYIQAVAKEAKLNKCYLIVSYHNFDSTPSVPEMCDIVNTCIKQGADVVKIATTAKDQSDLTKIALLYEKRFDTDLIAFAMGETGLVTRLICISNGAPWTYASISDDKTLASGQIPAKNVRCIINNVNEMRELNRLVRKLQEESMENE
ncbi:MAG: type I 3-dehydroquinate dehydratase [Prevotellaceae bacterium]|jgi:3-dehydroquinate dehydratase-1|nr:type I 3-dehydroquinate dehydratase [Prevotellaceae bacterium]